MIVDLVRKWEEGYPVVITVKAASDENGLMFWIRKQYYRIVTVFLALKHTKTLRDLGCLTARWWRSSRTMMIRIRTSGESLLRSG